MKVIVSYKFYLHLLVEGFTRSDQKLNVTFTSEPIFRTVLAQKRESDPNIFREEFEYIETAMIDDIERYINCLRLSNRVVKVNKEVLSMLPSI